MGANASSPRSKHKEYEDAIRCFDSAELEKWKKCFAEISHGSPSKKKKEAFSESQLSVSGLIFRLKSGSKFSCRLGIHEIDSSSPVAKEFDVRFRQDRFDVIGQP